MFKKSLIALSVAALAASSAALPAAAASTDSPVQLAMKHGCNPYKAKGCNPCAAKK